MKKSIVGTILVFMILIIVIIFGVVFFFNNNRESQAENVLDGTLNAIGGYTDYKQMEIPETIKKDLEDYQSKNLLSDDTEIILLDNVDEFNNQKRLLQLQRQVETYYNNLPETPEEMELYRNEEIENFDMDLIKEEYAKMFDIESIGLEDKRIEEIDNKYVIKLNDLILDTNTVDVIRHKGFIKEISYKDLNKETYSMRQNNDKHKYYIVDTKVTYSGVTFICASELDKELIEIYVKFSLTKPKSVIIR